MQNDMLFSIGLGWLVSDYSIEYQYYSLELSLICIWYLYVQVTQKGFILYPHQAPATSFSQTPKYYDWNK